MAFGDWVRDTESNWVFELTSDFEIEGGSSLLLNNDSGQASNGRALIAHGSFGGVPRGKARSIVKLHSIGGWTLSSERVGICTHIQSTINVTSNAYWAYLQADSLNTLRIGRGTIDSMTELRTGAMDFTPTAGSKFFLELEAQFDSDADTVSLVARAGQQDDFSDIKEYANTVDSSGSNLETGVSMGIGFVGNVTASDTLQLVFDKTQIFERVGL